MKKPCWLLWLTALIAAGCYLPPDDEEPAPAFPAVHPIGSPDQSVSVGEYRGKVVVVYLWATWCVPCRQLSPVIDALYTKYRAKGLQVLAVSSQESPDVVQGFLRRYPKASPVYLDSKGDFARTCGFDKLPTVIVIGLDGRVATKLEGVPSDAIQELDAAVRLAGGF